MSDAANKTQWTIWTPISGVGRMRLYGLSGLQFPERPAMTDAALSPPPPKPSAFHELEVQWVHHWTDQLFSFRVARPGGFRFRSGEFVMIGLPGADGGKPVLRAYSIASPSWDEELEFLSIAVPDGPLTSRLVRIQPGDQVLMGRKPTGTL
eukprot:gene54661-73038_t